MNGFVSFFKRIFSGQKARIRTLLGISHKNELPVRLILPRHDRVTTALVCSLVSVQRKGLLLECDKVLVPDSLNEELCTLYLKLEPELLPQSFLEGEENSTPHTGFMCSSRILRNDVDTDKHVSRIRLEFPHKYIVRELRRYERVRPLPKCIHTLVLWQNGGMPLSLRELGAPQFVTRPQGHPQISLVDISTGGAKIHLHNVSTDMAKGLRATSRNMTFLISLNLVAKNDPLSVLVNARCLEVRYDGKQEVAQLRLCFEEQGITGQGGRLMWTHLKDGVPQLTTWIEHDYHIFTSKKNTPA